MDDGAHRSQWVRSLTESHLWRGLERSRELFKEAVLACSLLAAKPKPPSQHDAPDSVKSEACKSSHLTESETATLRSVPAAWRRPSVKPLNSARPSAPTRVADVAIGQLWLREDPAVRD